MEEIEVGLSKTELEKLGVYEVIANYILTKKNGRGGLGEIISQLKITNRFSDCPYRCANGRIYDDIINRMVSCPHCSDKRKSLIINNGLVDVYSDDGAMLEVKLSNLLGIDDKKFKGYREFDFNKVIANQDLVENSNLNYIRNQMEQVYRSMILGEKLDASYCFGVGYSGNMDALVYPLLQNAYLSGLTVTRFLTVNDLYTIDLGTDDAVLRRKNYDDNIRADISFVLLASGTSMEQLDVLRDFMQDRARLGNATIFITTEFISRHPSLLSHPFENSLFKAKPVFVRYSREKVDRDRRGQAHCFDLHDPSDDYDRDIKIDSDY